MMEILFKNHKGADKRLMINFEEDVRETKYFIADENVESSPATDDETGQMSFIAFRIRKTSANGLGVYKNKYKPDDENSGEKKYVVVEFRSDVDCRRFIESVPLDLAPFFDKSKLTLLQVGRYSESMVTDSKQERRRSTRIPSLSNKEDIFSGMGDDDKKEKPSSSLQNETSAGVASSSKTLDDRVVSSPSATSGEKPSAMMSDQHRSGAPTRSSPVQSGRTPPVSLSPSSTDDHELSFTEKVDNLSKIFDTFTPDEKALMTIHGGKILVQPNGGVNTS